MYEDEPQDRVHDVLAEAVFGEHPLGRRVLGEAEVIASIPVPDIDAYHQRPLHRRRTSSSAPPATSTTTRSSSSPSGSSRRRPSGGTGAGGRSALDERRPAAASTQKDTEQYHICFGAPGITRDDERRYALAVLDSIFGGSTSSRLFREVREKRGLAYAVGSYNEQYTDSGPGRDLRRHPRGQRRGGLRDHRRRARRGCAPSRSPRGAGAGQGERQGPPRALLGVDRGADDADLARDPLRPADRQPRRDARQGRRGRRSTT